MIEANFERITPALAQKYLECNMVNRKIKEKRVTAYAREMKEGMWEDNGEAIRFNERGELIDGQHRLSAIIKSGVTVKILVMRGISNDITIYDRGVNRDEADSLIIGGMPRELATKTNIAVAKLHYYINHSSTGGVVARKEIIDFLERYEDSLIFVGHIASTSGGRKTKRVSTTTAYFILACLYALESHAISKEKLTRFVEVVKTGFYSSEDHESAAVVLRNDILEGNLSIASGVDRKFSTYKVEKAIYDFVNGYDRRQSYRNVDKPVYSNNKIFKEV